MSAPSSDASTTRRDHAAPPTAPAGPDVRSPQSGHPWSGGYEIALDALLSLGEDKTGSPAGQGHTPGLHPRAPPSNIDPAVTEDYLRNGDGYAQVLDDQRPLGFSESKILDLLRYYRYEIAPWVCSICTPFDWRLRDSLTRRFSTA